MTRRYKEARLLNNLKVVEAIEKLGISQPTLNAWEGERKTPSLDALENMADLYGVTTDYLLGRTNRRDVDPDQPIDYKQLLVMNEKPVWSPTHGWLLVRSTKKELLQANGTVIPFDDAGNLYYAPRLYEVSFSPSDPPLLKSELSHYSEIWVEPISPDSSLREELRGWYNIIGKYAENQNGNRFSFSSYEVKWIAFSNVQIANHE